MEKEIEGARRGVALALKTSGDQLAEQGEVAVAVAAYRKAQEVDPMLPISTEAWGGLCWNGDSLGGCRRGDGYQSLSRRF